MHGLSLSVRQWLGQDYPDQTKMGGLALRNEVICKESYSYLKSTENLLRFINLCRDLSQ